jgi:hypothetical protein
MPNTEGVHRPRLSQKAPAPIACRVFFGQEPMLYCQKQALLSADSNLPLYICITEFHKPQSIFMRYDSN